MNEWFHSPFKTALQINMFSPKRLHLYLPTSHSLLVPQTDTCWKNKQGEGKSSPLPSPLLPFLERTRVSSSLLPGTFSAEDNEQSQHGVTTSRVIFIQHVCHPRRKGHITWSLGAEIWRFTSPLWVIRSTSAAWTWAEAGTGTREADSCELTETTMAHPRLRWRIFLYRSLAHLYPRPSTSEVPCWMTHSWLHLCLKKYWVEIALTLAPVPQWPHSGSWSIMMRFCLNYNLQQIFFSYFFQKKNGLLSSLYFKFYLQVNIAFSPIYFYSRRAMDANRSQCFNCSNKMNHLFHAHFTSCKDFFLKSVSACLRVLK